MLTERLLGRYQAGVRGLAGKAVIITGAAGVIGSGLVRHCVARAGASVVATDVDDAGLDVLEADTANGGEVAPLVCDLTQEDAADRIVSFAVERFGRLDGLVNNAYWNPGHLPAEELTREAWRQCFEIGPFVTFYLCQAAFPHLREGGGRIVNLGSEMSDQPLGNRAAYSASKGAIRSLSKALARDWGRYGINVNTVWPSVPGRLMGKNPALAAQVLAETALGRRGDAADDVGPLVEFLLSDDSRWVTGQTLAANGGRTML